MWEVEAGGAVQSMANEALGMVTMENVATPWIYFYILEVMGDQGEREDSEERAGRRHIYLPSERSGREKNLEYKG